MTRRSAGRATAAPVRALVRMPTSLAALRVDGEERRRRGGDVGAERERVRLPGRAADGDRERDQLRVGERVQRDPEGGGAAQRLDPQLDQVGGVVRVSGRGRVVDRAVRHREQVGDLLVLRVGRVAWSGAPRGRRTGSPGRGTRRRGRRCGTGDEDRRRLPDAGVRQRRRRWRASGRGSPGRAAGRRRCSASRGRGSAPPGAWPRAPAPAPQRRAARRTTAARSDAGVSPQSGAYSDAWAPRRTDAQKRARGARQRHQFADMARRGG